MTSLEPEKCHVTGKLCYKTEKEAEDRLFVLQFWELAWYKQKRYYKCEFCGCFHLTSKDYDEERGKKR